MHEQIIGNFTDWRDFNLNNFLGLSTSNTTISETFGNVAHYKVCYDLFSIGPHVRSRLHKVLTFFFCPELDQEVCQDGQELEEQVEAEDEGGEARQVRREGEGRARQDVGRRQDR